MEILYEPYWALHYKRPWIGRIIDWKVGKKPDLVWGELSGHQFECCSLSIEAESGDIIRYGMTHKSKYSRTTNEWAVVNKDGELESVTPSEARKLFRNKQENENPV